MGLSTSSIFWTSAAGVVKPRKAGDVSYPRLHSIVNRRTQSHTPYTVNCTYTGNGTARRLDLSIEHFAKPKKKYRKCECVSGKIGGDEFSSLYFYTAFYLQRHKKNGAPNSYCLYGCGEHLKPSLYSCTSWEWAWHCTTARLKHRTFR